jgi:hypothetical protein
VSETIGYKLKKWIFRFIGDIKWAGILHPFWFVINSTTFSLKGKHYRIIEKLIKPGDILLRRFEGYLDKFLIPGWYNHAGIYVGTLNDQNYQVIHAISDGVIVEDLIDFARTDHMVILRAPDNLREEAISRAKEVVGSEYDFAFDFGNKLRFSCTELVSHCYRNQDWTFKGKKRFGCFTIVADDIINTPQLKIIWTSASVCGVKPTRPFPPPPVQKMED